MAQMTQILDNLRERFGELRGLERRSDDLMKQVIDRFYVVEGLNRLQTEIDCLDILVKNKSTKTSTANSVSDFVLETADLTKSNSKINMLKSIFKRSKRATRSAFSLLRSPSSRHQVEDKGAAKISGSELRKITRLQRAKVSELMTIVRSTIVTNYGVLEQLQLLYEMHDKNMALWQSIRRLAESILPPALGEPPRTIEPLPDAVEQRCKIDEIAMGEGIVVGKASHESVKSVLTVQSRQGGSNTVSNKMSQTEVLYERHNLAANADEQPIVVAGNDNGNDVVIGDGQTMIANPNVMTQTLIDAKVANTSETVSNAVAAAAETDVAKAVHSMKKTLKTAFPK